MKKISFGSFPLTEVKKEDRKCLDRYLIKSFSDNISISDAIRNLAVTKNMMYITPDALMRDLLGARGSGRTNSPDRESNNLYEQALERAFYVLKEIYSRLASSAFYRDFIYYPIYIEKVGKVTAEGSDKYDAKYTDVTMNYSFIVLSNDLTKNLKIDEIRYDENASLNFLFLFIEFFTNDDPVNSKSIHEFDDKDYEFLVKLYQLIEKSGKEPIQLVLDLYKVIGIIKKINTMKNKHDEKIIEKEIQKFFKDTKLDDFKKYKGLVHHQFTRLISDKKSGGTLNLRKAFTDVLNEIFNSKGLQGLYGDVDESMTRGERYNIIYNTSKYREILTLAKELVAYNKLNCRDVVTDDHLEMDFKIETSEKTLSTNTQAIAQKYQTFFKDYSQSIKEYFDGMTRELINGTNAQSVLVNVYSEAIRVAQEDLGQPENGNNPAEGLYLELERAQEALNNAYSNYQTNPSSGNESTIRRAEDRVNVVRNQIEQQENFIAMLRSQARTVPVTTEKISHDIAQELTEKLINAMVTNLTFVYDDGKKFFTNEVVAQGLINLASDSRPEGTPANCDLTTQNGFVRSVQEVNNSQVFPKELNNGEPNPAYFAALVAQSLDENFNVMADDAIIAFRENVLPLLRKYLRTYAEQAITGSPLNQNKGNQNRNRFARSTVPDQRDILDNLLATLQGGGNAHQLERIRNIMYETIFRNRFINLVLKKFLRMFNVNVIDKIVEYDQNISQLHPMIKKLIKINNGKGKDCQYFKSFIINLDLIEQLYRIKYISDTQKFLDGLIHAPVRKFNDPMNRIRVVLEDYLGLEFNPVWIISKTDIILSMPDHLSLTGTSVLSKVPKVELSRVCKIDIKDYWNPENMGKVAKLNNSPKLKKLSGDLEKLNRDLEHRNQELNKIPLGFNESDIKINSDQKLIEENLSVIDLSNKKTKLQKEIQLLESQIRRTEEDFLAESIIQQKQQWLSKKD